MSEYQELLQLENDIKETTAAMSLHHILNTTIVLVSGCPEYKFNSPQAENTYNGAKKSLEFLLQKRREYIERSTGHEH